MPMIVNTAWLLEYLEPKCSHEELLDAMPRVGLEIEQKHELRKDLEPVRIGFIRKKEPLPGAQGYYACAIEVERGRVIPVVCASEHELREGWGVPVAPAGTVLPTGRSIKADQFHGVRSEGMVCLDGEMGLVARNSGLHYVTDEAMLGAPLPAVAEIPEYLLELNVLPNRPDFLGLIGIAREIAALLRLQLRLPPVTAPRAVPAATPVAVEIREPELCPRYMCGLVRGVKVAPSPGWLKARLLLAGLRPINNVVDVTNYVLYEWGQPLHAFDFATLRGGRIVVRRMAPGESLELLTGKRVEAQGQPGGKPFRRPPLVIADAERPVALAGIMGGRATETADQTTEVLVEAAYFNPVNVRRTAKEVDLGMEKRGTDASHRFERGTDPNMMIAGALARALDLIVEVAGGSVDGPPVDLYPLPREPKVLTVSPERTSSYLGMPVPAATIRDCLERLKMECTEGAGELTVRVPTWRVDATDPVVLIEDVARMLGYDQIPVAPQPALPTIGQRCATDRLRQAVAENLVALGFYEARTPSLEPPQASAWLGEPPTGLSLSNWATSEMSVVRRTLLPGLAATVQNNIFRGAQAVHFFEVDRAFREAPEGANDPHEALSRWRVAAVAGGQLHRSNWRADKTQEDFFTLKGVLEDLLIALGVHHHAFQPAEHAPYLAGTTAELFLGAEPARSAGFVGEIDTRVLPIERLPFRVYAFELDLEALLEGLATPLMYRPVPRQPAVTRDLALVVPTSVAFSQVAAVIRQSAGPTLELLHLVDVYQGPQVPSGHQSLAFRLMFRHPDRTLTADEVAATMGQITSALKQQVGAELRG